MSSAPEVRPAQSPVHTKLTSSGTVPAGGTRSQSAAPAAGVSQRAADGVFAALGRGAIGVADLAGSQVVTSQAMALEFGAAGSAQADLDSLLWASEDSSWQDGERDWLP